MGILRRVLNFVVLLTWLQKWYVNTKLWGSETLMFLVVVGQGRVTLGTVWADSSYQVTNILPVCAYQQSYPQARTPEEWKHMLAQALHANIHSTNVQIPKGNSPETFRLWVRKQHLSTHVNTRWLSKRHVWNTEHARNMHKRQKTQATWFHLYNILRWLNWGRHCYRKGRTFCVGQERVCNDVRQT